MEIDLQLWILAMIGDEAVENVITLNDEMSRLLNSGAKKTYPTQTPSVKITGTSNWSWKIVASTPRPFSGIGWPLHIADFERD